MPLVGREREVSVFDEALDRAAAGERAVLVLTGEPGIGKSRLLGELATRGSARGAKVVWGRTSEVGLTPAFWPWMQILRALETPSDDDRAPGIGSLGEHADAASRLAMFDAAVSFIVRRAAAHTILVLLFDDMHSADPSSLQLLDYAVPLLADKRVVVALAARDGDVSPDVAAVLGRVQRGARRLPLARLSRADVDALVGPRADHARVFELSEGNPLFVEELVASAEAEGVLRLPTLSSVRAVIRERVAQLPVATQRLLVGAALLGRDLAGRVLGDILDERDVATALQPAVRKGMIAMTGPDRFRFSHSLLAETLSDELDPSERARLHLRAAQALEKHAGDPSEVAHHLLQAGNLAAEAAVKAAERAAHEAMTRLAFEDAAALLDRALGALQLAAPGDRKRRIQLACARIEALQQADDRTRALALLDEIEPVARAEGDPELLARLALARGMRWTFGETDPLLVAALREALAALGETSSVMRAKVLARLAAALQPADDPAGPIAHAREAIAMAIDLPPSDRLDVLYTATAALVDYLPPRELDAIHEQTLALARTRGARVIAAHSQLRMCFTALERIDRDRFEQMRAAYGAMAAGLGPSWTRYTHMLDSMKAVLDGRWVDSETAVQQAEALCTRLGDSNALWGIGIHQVISAHVRGELIGNIERLMTHGPVSAIRAVVAAHDGDVAAARMHLAACSDHMLLDVNVGAMVLAATALVGDRAEAARRYEQCLPRAGSVSVISMIGFVVQDLYDRLLLLLAATSERWDAIDAHAESALAIAHKLASPPWVTRVRADYAGALGKRDRPGDAERARALYEQAAIDAERLEMRRLAEHCRAALATVGASPIAPPPAKPQQGIRIAREGNLWIVAGFDDEIRVRDSRGMEMLARLVADPNHEIHVLDLMGAAGTDGGDAGELLDAKARAQYKARLAELMAERDRAEEWGDAGRAERVADEIEALTSELERAVGLGGRERRAGGAAERARSNVQRRLQHAIQQIRAGSRRLGEHFAATIKTGTLCVYEP